MLNAKLLFYIVLLWCASAQVMATSNDYFFKQISTKEGLSQSRVQCIWIDNKGYIWIGTESGLNCYDRHELRKYVYNEEDTFSLPSSTIRFITEDAQQNLWISTLRGLTLYNREKNNFTRIYQDNRYLHACSYLLLEDGILFGGSGVFYKYSYQNKSFSTITPQKAPECQNSFYQMSYLSPEVIIANTRWYGVYTYQLRTNRLKKMEQFTDGDYVTSFVDSHLRLWITAYGKGLYCYDASGKLLHHFTASNSKLKHNVILDIKERDNTLWIATDGGGISLLSLDDYSFKSIEHTPDDLQSLPSNSIYCLYNDQHNNMWIGSIRDGLLGVKNVHIRTFGNVPLNNPYGLSNKTVICMLQDKRGTIWVGTDGGGINRYEPSTHRFTHFPSTNQSKITSMVELNDQELLLSLFNEGLYLFNKQTGHYKKLTIIDEETDENIYMSAYTVNISKVEGDKVLICADKIYLYDCLRKSFSIVSSQDGASYYSPQEMASDSVSTFLMSKTNVYQWTRRTNAFHSIYKVDEENIINDGCRDSQGTFWLGGRAGLFRFNPQTGQTEKIPTRLFDEVNSLIADDQGRLWIGTRNRLFVYFIQSKRFVILGEADGIFPNEYTSKSGLMASTGDIYIGGTNGMSRISKNIRFDESTNSPISLTEVLLNGLPVSGEWTNSNHQITIPYNFTSLLLKIIPEEHDIFQTYAYQYSIQGLNDQTIQSYDPKIAIYSLPAGTYQVLVSYTSKEGEWTAPTEILTIHVTPPWWKSWWFTLLTITLFIGITFFVAHYIVKKKKEKQRREIQQFKQSSYEEKVRFLININHELRTPLTLIYAPLKRILNNDMEDAELESQLTSIYRQVKRMKNIINMVLDVRRMEVTQEPLHLSLHPLNDWVCSITDDFKNEFKAKNIEVICRFDSSIQEVPYDQTKCEIVLSNLLINALKFSEAGGHVTVSTQLLEERVRVSIIDNGIGLGHIDINKLFTRFYQGKHQQSGSGIGLSYSKSLMEMQGGSIGAANNPERGACFYFELPLKSMIDISRPQKEYLNELYRELPDSNLTSIQAYDTHAYSLLIAEDEYELRNFIKENLKSQYHHVYAAKNGQEAYDMAVQYQPDIVISDVMMPVCNGFELCRRIKEDLTVSHIPVILLTALNDREHTTIGYKSGADAYLSKPFEVEFLQAVIANQLRNREKMRARYKAGDPTLTTSQVTFSNADEQFLLKLNDFIQQNLSDCKLGVEVLAQNMGVSRSLLYNKVKALTDMGIIDYVIKLRIEKACQLLLQSEQNITEISEKVGFSTQRYFSKVFKQVTQMTPSQYKQNAGQQKGASD